MNLAVLCPGQGSQDAATLASLAGEPEAREAVEAFERATGHRVAGLGSLSAANLHANALAQPLVCATSLAAFAVLGNRIPTPCVFAGYSVGELAAYGCAGWLSPAETIGLAVERAAAMDDAGSSPAAMVAVRGVPRGPVDAATAGTRVFVAIVNGVDRFVLAGAADDMDGVVARIESGGGTGTRLGVRVASHTPLMDRAAGRFRAALLSHAFRPAVPVLAGVDGTPVLDRDRAIDTLSRQVREPVLWSACIRGLGESGADVAIELPPGASLSKMARDAAPAIAVRAVAEFRTAEGVAAWLDRRR